MSNNLSKLLVSAGVDLVVERALGLHQLVEGAVLHDVPRVQVDDVVRGLQVAEVVGDADRRRVLGQLVERLLERSRDGVVEARRRLVDRCSTSSSSCIHWLSGFPVFTSRLAPVPDV